MLWQAWAQHASGSSAAEHVKPQQEAESVGGGRPQPLGPRAQTPAEREERVIVRVPHVDRYLRLRPRPGHRQLAGERTLTEEDVRDQRARPGGGVVPSASYQIDARQQNPDLP